MDCSWAGPPHSSSSSWETGDPSLEGPPQKIKHTAAFLVVPPKNKTNGGFPVGSPPQEKQMAVFLLVPPTHKTNGGFPVGFPAKPPTKRAPT